MIIAPPLAADGGRMPHPTPPTGRPRPAARAARRALVSAVAGAAAAGACAPAATNQGPTPTEEAPLATRREVLRGGGPGMMEYHPDPNRARVIDLRVPPDTLWPRVIAAYERLGLPLGEVDRAAGSLGTSSVRAVGRLGGTPLGEYVDCGSAPLGTRAADTYIVYLRVVSQLLPQGAGAAPAGGSSAVAAAAAVAPAAARAGAPAGAPAAVTTLRTLVTASAKANATQGDPVDCISTGRLETRLVRLVAPAPARR
jgi:hypothetical protein